MDAESKEHHSKRIHQKEVIIKRKHRLAKTLGLNVQNPHELLDQSPVKQQFPKQTARVKTIQEQRNEQKGANDVLL